MANPHQLPTANTAFGRLSGASSPLPTRSSTPAIDYPQAFTAEQLEAARTSLRLNPRDFPDFSQDTLSGQVPSETATLTLLSQLIRGLVTISRELSGFTQKLAALTEENGALKEELHDISSQIANLPLPQSPPPNQDLSTLQSAIRDLSPRVTAPAPPLPQVPAPTPQPQLQHSARPPPPPGRGKKRPVHPPAPPPTPTRILNTSSPTTTQSLARLFVIRSATHVCSPTPMKPENSREGLTTLPLSPPATSTPTTPPHPRMLRLPPASARAAGPRKDPTPLHPNKLRARLPPLLRRGRSPSLVHNDVSLLFAFPQPHTLQLPRLQQLSLTSPLASCANPTASSLMVSPPWLTSAGPFRSRSLTRPPQLRPTPRTLSPSPRH